MSRPTVFHQSEYVGCLVDGQMAAEVRGAATRNGLNVSTFIRRALADAVSADMIAALTDRRSAA